MPDRVTPDVDLGISIQEVLAQIANGFVVLDNAWRFVYLNDAAQRLWGVRGHDLIGRSVFEAIGVTPDNPFHTCYTQSKASGVPVAMSAYSELSGLWLEVRGIPHPGGYAILFRDVSEARQAHLAARRREQALRTESAVNRLIIETSLDLIYVTDRQGNLVRVSPSARDILGYAPAEMEGRSAVDFIVEADLELTRREMRRARREGSVSVFDCGYRHKDGHVVPISWKGVWSAPAGLYFFIGRDMTERIRAEQRQRHTQRLEAIGRLTGGVAHDFNNILSVVMGNLDMIMAQPDVPASAKTHGEAVLRAAQRGADLTKGLLAFARQQPLRPATVDPNELIGEWVRLLTPTVGEHIEVHFDPGDDIWPVHIDRAHLETAIANLALNARDAMSNGGRLLIETRNVTLDDDYVRVNPEATVGDYVAVIVTDTGPGMAPDVLERVFEPFFTTKESGEGTGLGLAMVFGFVRQSGGHIRAYSEVGLGTSFRLYLPRADRMPVAATGATPAPRPAAGNETILVVEDNEQIRELVLRQLAALGYTTLEAGDAAAALAIIDGDSVIDLLFTDIVMPGGADGRELARAARQRRPGLKVLFTSGFPGAAMGEADLAGSGGLLAKPYRLGDLASRVRAALDGPT